MYIGVNAVKTQDDYILLLLLKSMIRYAKSNINRKNSH
jgi:hypothetical protein